MDIKTLDHQYVANTYKRFPVEIVSGHGSVVTDRDGKDYIDLGTGIAVNAFGMGDAQWQEAVIDQIHKFQHTSNLYYTEPCARLAQLLCEKTGMKKVFFSNSGAEANECAIKVARKYAAEKKGPDYYTILTLEHSFHGRTLTTLAATGQDEFHKDFQPLTPGFVHAKVNDLADVLEKARTHKLAGILIEVVQGEGGVIKLDEDFVQGIAQLCREQDIVLMCDEVQVGNGRSGYLYGYMHYGIQPDVFTTAKGLCAGLPLGATVLGEKVETVLGYGDNGSTFGGNPICCAGAISTLSRMDEALLAGVRERSERIVSALTGKKGVKSVSGLGLLLGIDPERDCGTVINECLEEGVLVLSAHGKVRLLPALNIPLDQLDQALAVLVDVLGR
ncbi:MAG TPA: aminotransferase class III-fold pyridoxal phosphate-dependent enzyme [Candidatus Avoscillospira stercorigallinarum]|uniref:Aminotransferase class III-fold pyridoxal phosphate-dependent enzyme n=1 Tax=Candidatus Avoscillospira stercorigallinarum TaxID=2840708 RepID=A0A9D0Z8A1_9FIRM|nr:aminotransferase class III-fold pyridoxal phosphate-dependent enzyme [Candidatus Avoscillospira stercorigallinarum]